MRIVIDIDDVLFASICESFAKTYGYKAQVPNEAGTELVDNPVTKEQFCRLQIRQHVFGVHERMQVRLAREAAAIEKSQEIRDSLGI